MVVNPNPANSTALCVNPMSYVTPYQYILYIHGYFKHTRLLRSSASPQTSDPHKAFNISHRLFDTRLPSTMSQFLVATLPIHPFYFAFA